MEDIIKMYIYIFIVEIHITCMQAPAFTSFVYIVIPIKKTKCNKPKSTASLYDLVLFSSKRLSTSLMAFVTILSSSSDIVKGGMI